MVEYRRLRMYQLRNGSKVGPAVSHRKMRTRSKRTKEKVRLTKTRSDWK